MHLSHHSRKYSRLSCANGQGQRWIRRNTCLSVEPLERRLLLAAVPMTLRITELIPDFTPDDFPGGGDGDFYAEVTIGNQPEQSTENFVDNPVSGDHLVNPPFWSFTEFINPADFQLGLIPVQIQIFDSDVGTDDSIDITPDAGNTLVFLFDPAGGALQGQAIGNGDSDVSATIRFEMFVSTPVTVAITEFQQIDDPDPESGDGEFKYFVKIGDNTQQDTGSFSFPPGSFGTPGLTFTNFVNPAIPVIKIRIAVEDEDLVFNDTMDINPRSGVSSLTLDYNITTATWAEEGGAFAFPQNFSQGNGDDDRGKIFFNIGPGPDTDGDGLFDSWETQGIDANGDGVIDLVLNTNPQHKDLFVEVDAMQSFAPDPAALTDVVAAFAAAPQSLVHNPDGQDGVSLHVQLDETNIPNAVWAVGFPEFDAIKQNLNSAIPGGFGSVADRASPNAANILAARRNVFRYSIFANQYGTDGSSGQSELNNPGMDDIFGGNDFFVTLGAFAGTRGQEAGTFMHELGHTLGLFHGGHQSDESKFNRKPDYHSVMNYIWQLPFLPGLTPTANEAAFANSWTLDYSRQEFNDLNENHLNETAGIGGHPGHVVRLENGTFVPESGPVDWNGDGTADDTDVALDVNSTSSKDTLEGSEDWSRLRYAFRTTSNFSDGVHGTLDPNDFTLAQFEEQNDALIFAAAVGNGADHLTLRRSGDMLEVFDNNAGVVVKSRALADTRLVQIIGAKDEDDKLTIDFSAGGYFSVRSGIEFNGGDGGNDSLQIVGTGLTTSAYRPSAVTPGAGTASVALGAESVSIAFAGLEPVEISAMASLVLTTPNSADDLTLNGGLASGGDSAYVLTGTSGGVVLESLTFFDITSVTVDAATNDGATPEDSIALSLGTTSAGVSSLKITTGAGTDGVTISASPNTAFTVDAGAGAGDTLSFVGEALTYLFTSAKFTTATRQPVVYAGVETVALFGGVFLATGTVVPNVIVDDAGTLGGDGTVQGAVIVNAGGTIDPGIGGSGILGTGNISFFAGGTYQVQLNGLIVGTGHDQLRVTGSVDLGGATLTGSLGFNAVPGDEIVILLNDGSDPIVGKFASGPGDIVTIGGDKFAVDYAFDGDGDGQFNDVALIRYGAELAPDPCDPGKTALFVSATTGDDVIRFVPATGNSRVRVLINGVDEGTFQPSGLLIGFGQSGNDRISVEMPSRDAWLYGQGGNDMLISGNGNSILLGGLGNDQLTSGNGKDILIGGAGANTLAAGNGTDLLIAGFTVFDLNNAANRAALCHIQEEWLYGSGGYSGRIEHLRFGGGRNAATVLDATTVLNDAEVDQLFGDNGQDWFLLNLDGGVLDASDRTSNETATDI